MRRTQQDTGSVISFEASGQASDPLATERLHSYDTACVSKLQEHPCPQEWRVILHLRASPLLSVPSSGEASTKMSTWTGHPYDLNVGQCSVVSREGGGRQRKYGPGRTNRHGQTTRQPRPRGLDFRKAKAFTTRSPPQGRLICILIQAPSRRPPKTINHCS